MRAILSKVVTGSMIAGAALLVSACGGNTTETTNTVVTDVNATDATMDGTVTDNMTAVDGAMGNDALLANDTTVTNDMMTTNETTATNAM
ncbi:hypothetical protein [Sphingomonas sp. DT-204]|uniref:hypothetical protein n=1 Tax=Sphingomonas sp. DT-204 TaxID=3396166 RepID=UPI003F1BB681